MQRLTGDLVSGELRPGAKLKLRELIERYGIGAHPLREALAQLAARGLVVFEGNKGFRVPPVSQAQLLDITGSRQIVEVAALKLAMEHGGEAWEEEIFISFGLLRREIERRVSTSQQWLNAYEDRHHRFHRALIAACPLVSLKSFCDDLYIQKTRYRRLLKEKGYSEDIGIAGHEELMRLVLTRDADAAAAALHNHIALTVTALLDRLATGSL
ncbi:GntR family transcriptional regulator [Azospirillum sp. sgz302134]